MDSTRRDILAAGAGLVAIALAARSGPVQAADLTGDTYDSGAIIVHPVAHASLVLQVPDLVIYVDPVGGADAYAGLPPPGLILVTHQHPDHFDLPTLEALAGADARLVTNPAAHDLLPDALTARAEAIANGAGTTVGGVAITAVPAYNTTPERLQYHPQGRDNGYVLEVAGRRIYVAGDTEDIPEMRALTGIDIAFVPMNLPYTMTMDQAASAVAAFAPKIVYPYHYNGEDLGPFEAALAAAGSPTRVIRGAWY